MLEFFNNNPIIYSVISAIVGACIPILYMIYKNCKVNRSDTISSLRKDIIKYGKTIEKLQTELDKMKSIEEAEKNIDKSNGSIYKERLNNIKYRDICGFCWENDHIKIPIVPSKEHDVFTGEVYYEAVCEICGAACKRK